MLRWSLVSFVTIVTVTSFEYIVNYGRVELAYYEKSLVRDGRFFFGKYNRTKLCLNVSFILLEDLNGNDLEFTTSMHQLQSNRYIKVVDGFHFNVCEYWKYDFYGTTTHLAKYGNLEGCNITKGFYYLYNYMPDESKFPKFVPLGSYMFEADVMWKSGTTMLKFQWYASATFKIRRRTRLH